MAIWLLTIQVSLLTGVSLAFWLSWFAKSNSRALYLLLGLPFWLAPAAGFCTLFALSCAFHATGNAIVYLPQATVLASVALVGGFALLLCGASPRDGGLRASQWGTIRLLIIWAALGAAFAITQFRIDANARVFAAETRSRVSSEYAALTGSMPDDADNARDLYDNAFSQIKTVIDNFDRELAKKRTASDSAKEAESATTLPSATTEPSKFAAGPEGLSEDDGSFYYLSKEEADRPETAELLRRLQPALHLIELGSERKCCRFNPAPDAPDHPSLILHKDYQLSKFMNATYAFEPRAVKAAQEGRLEDAMRDVETISRMAWHVDQTEPCVISGLVRMGVQSKAYRTLMEVLPYVKGSTKLSTDFLPDEAELTSLADRDFAGEQWLILGSILDFAEGNAATDNPADRVPRLGLYYRALWLRPDIEIVRHYMNLQREALRTYPTSNTDEGSREGSPLVQILLPALGKVRDRQTGLIGSARQVRIAFALTDYRLKHDKYPATLNELVPDYLKEIPADPFDGQPMRYRLDSGDAIIYSVGKERTDHGGTFEGKHRDEGFRLKLKMEK